MSSRWALRCRPLGGRGQYTAAPPAPVSRRAHVAVCRFPSNAGVVLDSPAAEVAPLSGHMRARDARRLQGFVTGGAPSALTVRVRKGLSPDGQVACVARIEPRSLMEASHGGACGCKGNRPRNALSGSPLEGLVATRPQSVKSEPVPSARAPIPLANTFRRRSV
jgi:hypothetical protein